MNKETRNAGVLIGILTLTGFALALSTPLLMIPLIVFSTGYSISSAIITEKQSELAKSELEVMLVIRQMIAGGLVGLCLYLPTGYLPLTLTLLTLSITFTLRFADAVTEQHRVTR